MEYAGGSDYVSGPYSVEIDAGKSSALFSVSITNDNILERNEEFTLSINASSLPNGVTVNGSGEATVFIVDDDCECTCS